VAIRAIAARGRIRQADFQGLPIEPLGWSDRAHEERHVTIEPLQCNAQLSLFYGDVSREFRKMATPMGSSARAIATGHKHG
jgi:hypothetical protein